VLNPDPNLCTSFCSRFTPTEANGFSGMNISRLSSRAIDDAWQAVATELDGTKRVDDARRAQQALADEVPALPLSPVLDIIVYNTAKIGGMTKVNPLWAFYNMDDWYCRAPSCRR
jgi:ABC-type transport system substrate-binding protein